MTRFQNMNIFKTLKVTRADFGMQVIFNRIERRNSLTPNSIDELEAALDMAEENPDCRMVIFEGQEGIFCTGMDFEPLVKSKMTNNPVANKSLISKYSNLLKCITSSSRLIISNVDGEVTAGGMGIVAASDVVISSSESRFSLSEALWGLMPSMVLPYLIRRVGFQKAYLISLTTLPISAEEALRIHLVDEISSSPGNTIRRIGLRNRCIEPSVISNIKKYIGTMSFITPKMEDAAVMETSRLLAEPKVRENIAGFVQNGRFPWEA